MSSVVEQKVNGLPATKQGSKLSPDIEETVQGILEGIEDLLASLEESASEYGIVSPMMDEITKAMKTILEPLPKMTSSDFQAYQAASIQAANSILRTAQDMLTKAHSNEEELVALAEKMSNDYQAFSSSVRGAIASTVPKVAASIETSAQALGHACLSLVKAAGIVQSSPNDNLGKKDLVDNSRIVSDKANQAISALKAGAKGTQACIDAGVTVATIISDLDTTITFAAVGSVASEPTNDSFADHRESIRDEAKAMVENTKALTVAATGDQEKLAETVQFAANTMTRLAKVMKLAAASLGGDDPEGQTMLINAVKDIASSLDILIAASRMVAEDKNDKAKMGSLHEAAKTMVVNVTSLLKTVKSVEDEATRGPRAAESTIEAITQEMKILQTSNPDETYATPDALIRSTKQVTLATAKAVGAGNTCKQEDVVAASNAARLAVFQMLHACRGAANTAKTPEIKQQTLDAGNQCATSFKSLMIQVHLNAKQPSSDRKAKLAEESKKVASSVGDLVQAAEILKGTDIRDANDNDVAENELLNAANAIEAAAKKLSALRPRAKAREADDTLTFEEQILEATKAIANATSVLVKIASNAQQEYQGKVAVSENSEDGVWTRGLISSARKVAQSTQGMCESAHNLVQGETSQAQLVTSARQVSISTTELLASCKVKKEIFGDGMRRLETAGSAVQKATNSLVAAAQINEAQAEDAEVAQKQDYKLTGIFAKEVAAQELILKKEKELEDAKKRLKMIKKARGGPRY
ncbi:talin-1-like [Apostichopus japonicus]|uniref:talin-1-like n=1 Tax=Stichopus japonicus TaxID=307972 RepID=UPI003AB6D967